MAKESGPGLGPSLFQIYLIENFTLKRVLHGTFGSCQALPGGRRLTALRAGRESLANQRPLVCGSADLQVAMSQAVPLCRAPGDFTVYASEGAMGVGEKNPLKPFSKLLAENKEKVWKKKPETEKKGNKHITNMIDSNASMLITIFFFLFLVF